jgi:hypothetical protein
MLQAAKHDGRNVTGLRRKLSLLDRRNRAHGLRGRGDRSDGVLKSSRWSKRLCSAISHSRRGPARTGIEVLGHRARPQQNEKGRQAAEGVEPERPISIISCEFHQATPSSPATT